MFTGLINKPINIDVRARLRHCPLAANFLSFVFSLFFFCDNVLLCLHEIDKIYLRSHARVMSITKHLQRPIPFVHRVCALSKIPDYQRHCRLQNYEESRILPDNSNVYTTLICTNCDLRVAKGTVHCVISPLMFNITNCTRFSFISSICFVCFLSSLVLLIFLCCKMYTVFSVANFFFLCNKCVYKFVRIARPV